MPFFVQLQFQSDWLCYKPFSCEKRFMSLDGDPFTPWKEWKPH